MLKGTNVLQIHSTKHIPYSLRSQGMVIGGLLLTQDIEIKIWNLGDAGGNNY